MARLKTHFAVALLAGFACSDVHLSSAAEPATRPGIVSDTAGDVITPPGNSIDQPVSGTTTGTAPNGPVASGANENRRRERLGVGEGLGRIAQRNEPLSAEETAEATAFLEKNSPLRWNAINSLPEGPKKTKLMAQSLRASLNMVKISKDDAPLYAIVGKRVALEDAIFGKAAQVRTEKDFKKQDTLRTELKQQVQQLVDIGIDERRFRLNRLAETVKMEEASLQVDITNKSDLVDKRYKSILANEDPRAIVPKAGDGQRERAPRP